MPKTIYIGKSPDNNYVISHANVSRKHAMLIVADDNRHAILRDLGSTNGTFVNGIRINQDTPINIGSQLRFGPVQITLADILSQPHRTPTPQKDTPNSRLVGRSNECHIRMNHDDVSTRHAILTKRDAGSVMIEDCDSTNGTYVNGERIKSRVLKKGDRVTITRNYPLNWETVFADGRSPRRLASKRTLLLGAAAVVLILVCVVGLRFLMNKPWSQERIYKEFHSAVCWIYVEYGYQVLVDGENFTPHLCPYFKIEPAETVHFDADNKLLPGVGAGQGTAFFISHDGKLATNLHNTRPWLFNTDHVEMLEDVANKILSLYSMSVNPLLSRSKMEVKCVITGMYIVPDGLTLNENNFIAIQEIYGHDDINKDVAIVQTVDHRLPPSVTSIIDITQADTSAEALAEGKTVFTIGYPYGADIALTSNNDLKNQVHGGAITQNRGEFEFGHDAATAGGASGSPILNDHGRLIGIHHAGMTGVTGAQGFNMAIKAKYIIDIMK